VGTLGWADETWGLLRLPDRLVLLGQGAPTLIEELTGRVLGALRRLNRSDDASSAPSHVDIELPATRLAKTAHELCEQVSERWLRDHCYRTYAIGTLLGRGLPFDPQVLFVACMLHDVGLTESFKHGSDPGLVAGYARRDSPCFAVRGAGVAHSMSTTSGWSPAHAEALAETISIHLNVRVPRARSVEAYLLNAGSALDVIRLRSHRLPPEAIRSIEARWPRNDSFCRDMANAWHRESADHRGCRAAFLNPWGWFERRIHATCRPHRGRASR